MNRTSAVLQERDLSSRDLSAIRVKSRKLGLTVAQYLKQLIEDDLALDQEAQTKSLDELAAPFRKAFAGVDEEQLDQLVARARRQTKRARAKR